MGCVFCEKNHAGAKIKDNMESSKHYLTCDGKKLFLTTSDYKYKGCFDIKFCPVCGRELISPIYSLYRGCKQCRYHDVCVKRHKNRYCIEYKAMFGCSEFSDKERSKSTFITVSKLIIKRIHFAIYKLQPKANKKTDM